MFLFQISTNDATFSSIVNGNIDKCLCEIAENAGIELANRLLATEAATILKEAKEQTAKAVIEEKERKAREAAQNQK